MKYTLEITFHAMEDIDQAYLFIREDSPANAETWKDGLMTAARTLAEFPRRCPFAPEARLLGQEIRQLLYGAYRILFMVTDDRVQILHVRHGARQPMGLDEEMQRSDD